MSFDSANADTNVNGAKYGTQPVLLGYLSCRGQCVLDGRRSPE